MKKLFQFQDDKQENHQHTQAYTQAPTFKNIGKGSVADSKTKINFTFIDHAKVTTPKSLFKMQEEEWE